MRIVQPAATLALVAPTAAHAGVYSDDPATCVVGATTPGDKTSLVRWIFGHSTLQPLVADITSLTAEVRENMNRDAAHLLERLLTEARRTQTQGGMRNRCAEAMRKSFEVLGQAAMQERMADESVRQGFGGYAKCLDRSKFEALNAQ